MQEKININNLSQMEFKANLNQPQKKYLETLKAKLSKVSGGRTFEQMQKDKDADLMRKYNRILAEILEFLRTKEELVDFYGQEMKKSQAKFLEELAKQMIMDNVEFFDELSLNDRVEMKEKYENKALQSVLELNEKGEIIELKCDHKGLSKLPELPASLQKLDCKHNYISELPKLPASLKELNCYNNKITTLPALPNSLFNLDVTFNSLTQQAKDEIKKHKNFNNFKI